MDAFDRLSYFPIWIPVGVGLAVLVFFAHFLSQRYTEYMERRADLMRHRRELGYAWSWREFWFSPRQRKLPPPRRRNVDPT